MAAGVSGRVFVAAQVCSRMFVGEVAQVRCLCGFCVGRGVFKIVFFLCGRERKRVWGVFVRGDVGERLCVCVYVNSVFVGCSFSYLDLGWFLRPGVLRGGCYCEVSRRRWWEVSMGVGGGGGCVLGMDLLWGRCWKVVEGP